MNLKSIEIRGFKSFANKTELTFKNGITAIVGPNGSGKSNISDAIRWVLGEQSVKSLRGGKMEDVIFAGTQFRKAVSLAQVSLTLDNSNSELPIEYCDVTISRRIYRSGDSEYYINNTQCRLKDIQELFMDTGIGKEGYSIIGQGKIEAILSGKPEERRSLLEEAAGIVKFKRRKEEAEKKLESTESNLTRIMDILSTYEERLEPLKIESEKANKFVQINNELKNKEVNLTIHSIENVVNKISDVNSKMEILKREIENIEKNTICYKNVLNDWNKKLENLEEKISVDKKNYYNEKEQLNKIIGDISILKERINNFHKYINDTLQSIDEIRNKISSLKIIKDEEEKKLKEDQVVQKDLNSIIINFENDVIAFNSSIEDKLNKIKKYKEDQIEYLSNISNVKNEIIIITNNIEVLNKKLDGIKSSCESCINSIKINSNTALAIEEEIKKLNANVLTYEDKIKKNKKEISNINSLLGTKDKKLKDLNNSRSRLEANHNLLVNLDKHYEGYNKSVKTLMQHIHKDKIKRAYGNTFVLGEIIEVKREFETAIEIALGGAISDIITLDEGIAKILINYLKENNLGRATFLPLNIIKGKKIFINEDIKSIPGYIGIGSELISYDTKFSNAIEYVLGRTIICKDMDTSLVIAKKIDYSYRIVTLSGEVINAGGSLTGGSVFRSKNTNIIGRKREIEEVKEEMNKVNREIEALSNSINFDRENIKKLDEESLNLKDQVYYENIETTKLQEKLSSICDDNIKLKNRLEVWNKEIENINEELNLSIAQKEEKMENLNTLQAAEEENSKNIVHLEELLENRQKQIAALRDKLTSNKIKKAQIDEVVSNKLKDLIRIDKEIEELNIKHEEMINSIDKCEEEKHKCEQSILEKEDKCKSITNVIEKLENNFKEGEIQIIKIKDSIKENKDKLDECYLIKNKKDSELHKIEIYFAKIQSEKEILYNKLNEEHNLDYIEAIKYKEPIENIETYKNSIYKLKSQITSLGVVNLGAVEEYKEVKEKYTFMNNQKEDLITAKQELLKLIEEMTDKMRVVFNENFNKLKVLFNETFKQLFKGGNADLILSSGDELNGAIDITVQPPGKKLQNINLMSGGEKVLSAIALLFAILKMKPTPFCILDEIEAALDDANVMRYAEFLKEFSGNVQFIVITHRKGTMEASDVLYGVTMEEKGVSKIISVDLTN
ncbi:chromosome segregation protein [Clostridium tetanomorphum]|uniref:Chromosome partition protein Smc n=1 Tax=Clostridium tetanomorphum TaxID=1553 RepID=A0A923J2M5_CLOTT|nr:chromosome segregation protein SMC [Clostridium tetanomorphum]KAJ51536.1 chromosome segregation protein SMC [Clostridium tetanomorphum DSM 665]MBC2398890.1 chromosome segregation protein SMC [Clostridium tetanomorphum]MBP1865185.1 chromosome segregation protein [Clostridium tetanomorphum]NRS84676.1 chromosome segregation protein [Clostridium tetanomorphum]NRZ97891.1 chromosome segregation protein [Clostridium tetanomorphum]